MNGNDSSVEWGTGSDTLKEPSCVTEFKWKIEDFNFSAKKVDEFYESPKFSSPGVSWCLRMYPHGESTCSSEEWIGIYLKKCKSGSVKVDYIIGIEKVNGSTEFKKGLSEIEFFSNSIQGWIKFLKREELMRRKSEFYPLGILTISITLTHEIPENLKPNELTSVVGNVVIKDDWKKNPDLKGLTLLSDNLQKIFLNGEDADITITVKRKFFKAHKAILKARSEVLSSMLTHNMVEKNNNKIKIDDCEPEAFEIFLRYLYSGKVEKITDSNMLDVFYIADKYCISALKTKCVSYIKYFMSVEDICSILSVARKYDELELLECATDYFIENAHEIILTSEWGFFSKDNPAHAIELLAQAFKRRKLRDEATEGLMMMMIAD